MQLSEEQKQSITVNVNTNTSRGVIAEISVKSVNGPLFFDLWMYELVLYF